MTTREQLAVDLIEKLRKTNGDPIDVLYSRWQGLFREYDEAVRTLTQQHPTREQIAEARNILFAYADRKAGVDATFVALYALLSQPTQNAAPQSVVDMATGTTLEEGIRWTVARDVHGHTFLYRYENGHGRVRMPDEIDPATIRNITPPEETS